MSSYFKNLPDLDYVSRLPNARISDYVRVKNLFKRGKIRDDIFRNVSFFERYKINGDDRSELILSYATNPNIVNLTNLQEYWFGWSILLPTNWPTNWPSSGGPDGGWTDQWHVADSENCPNWSATRQPLTFEIERVSVGNYRFKVIPAYNNTYCTGITLNL